MQPNLQRSGVALPDTGYYVGAGGLRAYEGKGSIQGFYQCACNQEGQAGGGLLVLEL